MRRYLLTTATAAFLVMAAPAADGSTTDMRTGAFETAAVAVQRLAARSPYMRDEVVMVLIGTALIGLASAVRRVDFD
ncbi:MAG TPA: hypothetical protein VGD94_18440 [Vicinamibacterales bacterium]